MSVSKQFALDQLSRMGNLAYAPQAQAEVDEIIFALMACDSEKQCRAIVSERIRRSLEFPKPAHIYAAVDSEHQSSEDWRPLDPVVACVECGGTGFSIVVRAGMTGARLCSCCGPSRRCSGMCRKSVS